MLFSNKTHQRQTLTGAISATTKGGNTVSDDLIVVTRRNRRVRERLRKEKSVSDLLSGLLLDTNKENRTLTTESLMFSSEDFKENPDLWMAAFDNPHDFIQYCRKRLDHDRKLLEKSRRVENEITTVMRTWAENSGRHEQVADDMFRAQRMNDKLQEVIMEERTHCQHLVGLNDKLETQRQIMSRKYQAALLLGKVDEKSVHHLLEKKPNAVPLVDRLTDLGDELKKCNIKRRQHSEVADPTILADKVMRLESYIEELKAQHREEVVVLKDTVKQNDLKCEAIKAYYVGLLKENSMALEETKLMLSASVNENLQLRNELLAKEDKFFQLQLGQISNKLRKNPLQDACNNHEICEAFVEADQVEKDLRLKLARTEVELLEKSNILRDATGKLLNLERKRAQLEEEVAVMKRTHKASVGALRNRNEVLAARCDKTDERRKLDNAGFRGDVQHLKTLLGKLNKSVQKFIKISGESSLDYDHPPDALLEAILVNTGFQGSLENVDPKLPQKAMSMWAEFVGKKVKQLDEKVHGKKVLYHELEPERSKNSVQFEK